MIIMMFDAVASIFIDFIIEFHEEFQKSLNYVENL